jgi:hypothetical protein
MPATVSFDRSLFYGDMYAFTLSYDIAPARTESLLISEAYVFLPAIALADTASTVSVRVPNGDGWDVTIDPIDCTVPVGETTELQCKLTLTVSHFPGEEEWAQRVRTLAEASLPVLEELFGFPYEGPRELLVAERGRRDIFGYEGTFICLATTCEIGVSPVANDLVMLHEFAHLWTEPFAQRWLAEGLAEYMSRQAAEQLATLVDAPSTDFPGGAPFPLDEWGRPRFLIGADDAAVAREGAGYVQSLRFFERLVDEFGMEAVQKANAGGAEEGSIDSRRYLDLLEEENGGRFDHAFLGAVFPESFASTLEHRRAARTRLAEVTAAAEQAQLELPSRGDQLVGDWSFDLAEAFLDEADEAIEVYTSAQETVEDKRSLWQRIGLIGTDPEDDLRAAAASFHDGDFERSMERAQAAEDAIDGARRAGVVRAAIAFGALAIMLTVLVAVVGLVWLRPRATQTGPRI